MYSIIRFTTKSLLYLEEKMTKKLFLLALIFLFSTSSLIASRADLVAFWPLDEGVGKETKDQSNNENTGTFQGDLKWTDGKFGKALLFEPGNYVEFPATDSLHADIFKAPFTFAAWIKPKLEGDQWQHTIRSVNDKDETQNTLFVNTDGRLSWRGRVGGQWTTLCETNPGVVTAETWTHIAVRGDEKNFHILINGEIQKESEWQDTDGGIENFYLGFDGRQWNERFNGVMDDVVIFDEALSSADIKKLMEGATAFASVSAKRKLATSWGELKID